MKRITLITLTLALCLATKSQTNFRDISYDDALATAKTEGKLVFMDFYTDWCGPCKFMAKNIFPQSAVGEYMNKVFVCIKVNAEKGEGIELAKTYNIKAYPTFVIIDGDKVEKGRFEGSRQADALTSEIDRIIDSEKTPARLMERYASGERTPDLVKAYASYLLEQAQSKRQTHDEYVKQADQVKQMVQAYFADLPDSGKLKNDNMFVYRTYTHSPFDASARYMIANRDKFTGNDKKEVAELIKKLYQEEVVGALCGTKPINTDEYATLKKEIKTLGLNDDKQYDQAYKFIDTELKNNAIAYISYCDKNINNLPEEQRIAFVETFASHFKDADEATKKTASQVLRDKIGQLPFTPMYFVVMQIGELEGQGH